MQAGRRPASEPAVHWRATGRGPALVLLNGWSAPGVAWPRGLVRGLEADFRLIRIDNRGAGWSRHADTPFTMADLADDVTAVLEAAGLEQTLVLGFSMGGMIAQELALQAPERVRGLVLVATAPPIPGYRPRSGGLTALLLFRPPLAGESLDAYFRRLWTAAAAPGFGERHPGLVDELVRQLIERPTPRGLLMHQLRAVFGWGHAERLASIAVPTTVVHGAEDRLVEPGSGQRLAELIPGSRYVELAGVGHLVPHEAAGQLLEVVRDVGDEAAGLDRAA